MSDYGVLNTGFVKKTFGDIKNELEIDFKEFLGGDIDLDPSGTIGQLIGYLSNRESFLWDTAEAIYNSRDPQKAEGTALDAILAQNGLKRLQALPTTVEAVLKGDSDTVIPAGKIAQQNNGDRIKYSLVSSVTISDSSARYSEISVSAVTTGNDYTVTINGTDYTYTVVAGDTEIDILNVLASFITAGDWNGVATVDTDSVVLELTDTDTDFAFSIAGDLKIEQTGSAGNFEALTVGPNVLPAETLTIISTPVSGWDAVLNYSAGSTGRAIETDSEARIRRLVSLFTGNANTDAIVGKMLNDVDGVLFARLYNNRTDATDGELRPPHSFEMVIDGGDDTEVAQKIMDTQPAGIASYGNTTISVTDSQGIDENVSFSRPDDVYIFVKVQRALYSEEDYPANGDTLIAEKIVEWSLNKNNITIGTDVILQRLSIAVYDVPGVSSILITADSSTSLPHTPSYSTDNIAISDRERAVFAESRIVVEDLT